jgi:Calcineurin-like phosphoesterase/Purple acid Phosphatase, N-terminal domain
MSEKSLKNSSKNESKGVNNDEKDDNITNKKPNLKRELVFWIIGLASIPLLFVFIGLVVMPLSQLYSTDLLFDHYGLYIIPPTILIGFLTFGAIIFLVRIFKPKFLLISSSKQRKWPKKTEIVSMFLIMGAVITMGGMYGYYQYQTAEYLEDQSKTPWVLWADDPTTSIRICWETKEISVTELKWGMSNISLSNAAVGPVSKVHYIDITPLTPNTTYYYQVSGQSKIYSFTTVPASSTNFRFMKVGDSQYNVQMVDDSYSGGGSPLVLKHMRANYESTQGPDFDFFLTSGDQVDRGKLDHFKRYFSDWEWAMSAGIPWVAASGNHETYFDPELSNHHTYFNYTGTRSMPGKPENFWCDYGNTLVLNLFLSTSGMFLTESDPVVSVLAWAEGILEKEAANYEWIILNQHHPVFMSAWYPSSDNPKGYDPKLVALEIPMIEKYGIDLVLAGHWHSYERLVKGNCTYMVTGGGGGGLDGWGTPQKLTDGVLNAESLAFDPTTHSYTVFDVSGTSMNLLTWATDGSLIDNATIYAN